MFEDRTQDIILAEMLSEFGKDVRTDEGSLAYNACVRMASELEDVYADMEELNDNMLPDTQDLQHLIRFAEERGISYTYATYPVVQGTFSQEIELGEVFTCGDYDYTVMKKIEDFVYEMRCDTEGTEANANFGELLPVEYIDEYRGGEITELIEPGIDDEEEENFRKRVIASFQSVAFGGNKADYRNFINAIPGVGGCKPKRREPGSDWVYITVINSENKVPSDNLISAIQNLVDPEQSHGEGDGMAPICHQVLIQAVQGVTVNMETTINFDDGYNVETSGEQIRQVFEEYLQDLRERWEDNEFDETIVRISQLDSRILNVEGVLDLADTKLNDTAENLFVNFDKIPLAGEVVIHV